VFRSRIAAVMLALASLPAAAEVVESSPEGVIMQHRFKIAARPADAWETLIHPEHWWPDDHTWSGSAKNMRLSAEAGGCFCEHWEGGSVEHGRVIMALPGRLLRFQGSLGPLQDMAVTGVLTVKLEPADSGTTAIVTYRLSGDASHGLGQFAPVVDGVIGQQFGAFASFAAQPADPGKSS